MQLAAWLRGSDMKKFLLVCEGPTDVAFIKEISRRFGDDSGQEIDVIEMSPQKDATSGQWPSHGWSAVRSWCKAYKKKTEGDLADVPPGFVELLRRRYWKSVVEFSGADGLIIQMDTDIAEKISDLDVGYEDSSLGRREYCRNAVFYWLGEDDAVGEKAYMLLPTYAMESWVLAIHDQSENVFNDLDKPFDYEAVHDFEERLVQLGYPSKKVQEGRRLKKRYGSYSRYAGLVFQKLDLVRDRCSEAEGFFSFLES